MAANTDERTKQLIAKATMALHRIQRVIESTYAHDDDGERDEDGEPDDSAADTVEALCNEELFIEEVISDLIALSDSLATQSPFAEVSQS